MNILDHIKAINPNVKFMLENVKMKKSSMDVISGFLGVEPVFINSSLLTAHNRQRYYWFNWKVEEPKDKGILLKDIVEYGNVDRDKAYCIDANYFKGGNPRQYFEKSRRQLVFEGEPHIDNPNYRKLTVKECERLQGLPDGYTEGVSDTQRYRMLGNGWTIPVISHIFEGLKAKEKQPDLMNILIKVKDCDMVNAGRLGAILKSNDFDFEIVEKSELRG